MRLLALGLLALAAAADASATVQDSPAGSADDCRAFCTREYVPVCGSNGVKYGNDCMFQAAQCLAPSLTRVDCAKHDAP